MRISVAMCTYNGAPYLEQQLASIGAQLRLPDELVVCDDKSADATQSILERFAGSAPFPVRIFTHPRNLGTTKNFEAAIGRCSGDTIVLADQDDVWMREKLARLEHAFQDRPDLGCVFTNAVVTGADLEPMGPDLWDAVGFSRRERNHVAQGRGFPVLLRHNVATGATMAFRAELRELVLPIPVSGWVHDEWIALIAAAVCAVEAIDEPLIKYRQHGGNQIGVTKRGLVAALRRWRGRDMVGQLAKYEELAARLSACAGRRQTGPALHQVAGKLAHIRARIQIREHPWVGWLAAIRELLFLRYHRYSNGIKSLVSDLVKFAAQSA